MNKIFIKRPGNATTVAIFAPIGSRFESPQYKGISHVLEHMAFKGTTTRTAKQIAKEIEQYGADFNAFTDWEITAYWTRIANEYADKGIAILEDMLFNSTFEQKELTKEMKVILEELKMYEDSPQDHIWDLFMENLTKENDGFHISIIGTRESLVNIDRIALIDFYKNYYRPNQLTLLVVGDVAIPQIVRNSNLIIPRIADVRTKVNNRTFIEYKRDNLQQSNMIIGNIIRNSKPKIDNYFLCCLMSTMLNGMSGRLFTEVREKHNLVYRIRCGTELYRCGNALWTVSLGLDKANIDKACEIINQQLVTLKDCSKKELDYTINKLIGQFALSLDSNLNVSQRILYAESRGVDFKKVIYGYADEIKRVGKDFRDFVADVDFKNALITALSPNGETNGK